MADYSGIFIRYPQSYKGVWNGNCAIHGEWANDFKDGCPYEQWLEEGGFKRKRYVPIKQRQMTFLGK